ncbi:alpha-tocopherol transfer protein-like [Odontomachus brunneus]|uniref:alpha-tocopherol transfer protein-like n=1 Tax=Odontomachus brunneus TaxID=486640 RepID=UPI0013F1920E|nr:alpha-tocopherol transfer protein-like [Odontomachus brunneus]XP_032668656.1 alpha-tocopherol transfer protein-like [Odontomachus brunneus]XP_032668657.1 alpha-tocopherol transfer protein-like [Odontomachus brunneus]XP_032668658.1 alpha-tocopherol transfer protein-like [Odontomachus brunneus]XP_032668660.1 alpha-tocopherol transfer protein-like [Odontomachus brunneus]XP_032668661.1 alpha-tocopherol transfer protein-like [Odontomachus brunneus]
MDTMSSLTTITDDNMDTLESYDYKKIIEYIKERLNTAPKVSLSGYTTNLEIFDLKDSDDCDLFVQIAKEDLRETPETVAQSIKELKELLAGEPDLHIFDSDEFYTIFLRPCKWYAQSALLLIKGYFRFFQNYSLVKGLIPSKNKLGFYSGLVYPLPLRGKEGCRIFIIELGKQWNPKKVSLNDIFKTLVLCQLAAIMEPKTQISGGRTILDFNGLSLSQVTYYSPSFAKMVVDYVQKALPVRIRSIHIVNQPIIFNIVFAMFKPLLQEKIRKRIHFHGTDRESLMTFIDKSVLLKKYGGELDVPDESYSRDLWKHFCAFDPLFEVLDKIGYTDKK